jgi:transposase
MEPMARPSKYPVEFRERAVRLVHEHAHEYPSQWAAIRSIAEKLDCTTEVVRRWVRQAERDAGQRPGLTTNERERLKVLERENRELKRANDILRKASAFFAQAELDRRSK